MLTLLFQMLNALQNQRANFDYGAAPSNSLFLQLAVDDLGICLPVSKGSNYSVCLTCSIRVQPCYDVVFARFLDCSSRWIVVGVSSNHRQVNDQCLLLPIPSLRRTIQRLLSPLRRRFSNLVGRLGPENARGQFGCGSRWYLSGTPYHLFSRYTLTSLVFYIDLYGHNQLPGHNNGGANQRQRGVEDERDRRESRYKHRILSHSNCGRHDLDNRQQLA